MRNYWWPGVTRDVGRYMEGCDLYQRMKNRLEEPAGKIKVKQGARETMDASNSRLHYEVASDSREG